MSQKSSSRPDNIAPGSSADSQHALQQTLLQLADDHLILGHRLSEWCGHAPMLEEDLSMPNMALDLIGQARVLYSYAAELEGKGRTEDDLAYLRSDREYLNCLLVEKPNADFAHTMLKQFYFTVFMQGFWVAVAAGQESRLKELASKAIKEVSYHIKHSAEWVVRLGDGTEESTRRMRDAVDLLHPYTGELFEVDQHRRVCIDCGWIGDPAEFRSQWQSQVEEVFGLAALTVPTVAYEQSGGRRGMHTEDFGHLLSQLQYLQRSYPGVSW